MSNMKKNKHTSDGRTTISGHKQVGGKLIPPMMGIPKVGLQSWMNDRLPEMLWAALAFSRLPQRISLRVTVRVVNFIGERRVENEKRTGQSDTGIDCDVTLSGLAQMDETFLHDLLVNLMPDEKSRELFRPLLLLEDLPAKQLWSSAIQMQVEPDDDWNALMRATALCLDHQSQESTDCRFIRVMSMIAGGRLHMPREILDEFVEYPNVDMQKVRPSIRAAEGALSASMLENKQSNSWPNRYWDYCLRETPCWPLNTKIQEERPVPAGTTRDRLVETRNLLVDHCNKSRLGSSVDARFDTTFGIGLYCLNLLEDILRIGIGNSSLGRFGLRTLVDCLITLAYLSAKNNPVLWKSYRVFGAGQAKLQYLKLEEDQTKPTYVDIQKLKSLANEDVWEEYLSIELGHWEKSNTRKMSEEGGVKDFYDRFYGWTSTYSHGHWGALRDTVFDTCGNPLHRLHRIPRKNSHSLPDLISDATVCVDKILEIISYCYPEFPHRVSIEK